MSSDTSLADSERLLANFKAPSSSASNNAELSSPKSHSLQDVSSTPFWRAAHAGSFMIGGTTFIAGTGLLFPICSIPLCATLSAVLYTVGSLGFLAVDLLETWAFSNAPCTLRLNIGLSALGSSLYVFGSVCFLPNVIASAPGGETFGLAGFLAGSAVIALSQLWKVTRVLQGVCSGTAIASNENEDGEVKVSTFADAITSLGVEGSAGLGALLFLLGSAFDAANLALAPVLWTWMAGSAAFTSGAVFLFTRHYLLGIT